MTFIPEEVPDVAGTLNRAQARNAQSSDPDRITYIPGQVVQAFGGNNQSGPIDVATALNACKSASGRQDFETETFLVEEPMAFDPTQITSKTNRSQPAPGKPAPTLTKSGYPPAIVYAPEVSGTLMSSDKASGSATQQDAESDLLVVQEEEREVCVTGEVTHCLKAEGADASEDGTGRGVPIVTSRPIGFSAKDYGGDAQEEVSPTLRAGEHRDSHQNGGAPPAVAYSIHATQTPITAEEVSPCLASESQIGVQPDAGLAVRRLTPRECERLQAFPDDRTLIPVKKKKNGQVVMASDSVRYRALGNSMAVVVMAWLGRRIDFVHKLGGGR